MIVSKGFSFSRGKDKSRRKITLLTLKDMKRREIITSFSLPFFEILGIISIFFIAYYLRQITDGIPFIQLPIPYISQDQFVPFILSWAFFWWIIFMRAGLYRYEWGRPLLETIRDVLSTSTLWFILYIGFVYLSTGFFFEKEIPRLIIGYVWILASLYAVLLRILIHTIMGILYSYSYISKNRILIIRWDTQVKDLLEKQSSSVYLYEDVKNQEKIHDIIRSGKVDMVLSFAHMNERESHEIIKICSIYGIWFSYPRIPQYVYHITRSDSFVGWTPVVLASALAMSAWDRITKRILDIILSIIFLSILSPLFLAIMLLIKIEDHKWPTIYKNRRIGLGGKEFFLYKFRYMYWKYSIKDAYGVEGRSDIALKFEEELKKTADMRDGPLYKIANDPRKTHIGKLIERLSLDELPQLWNVLKGNMSLVWPRPHQPREVDLYDEHHHQVLTVKPGITGMAQVSWREQNSFEEEVTYDIYYIENYSILLDFLIIAKTIWVVLVRAFWVRPLHVKETDSRSKNIL